MKSINKVTLLGAVGQDPETRYSASGTAIATFSLATSAKTKDKEEVTQWHNCVAFGKLAEIIQQYVTKGTKLYVDGTIQYQQYDKEGEKRFATKIVVNDVSMLSPAQGSTPISQSSAQKGRSTGTSRPKAASVPLDEFDDDSIPF